MVTVPVCDLTIYIVLSERCCYVNSSKLEVRGNCTGTVVY